MPAADALDRASVELASVGPGAQNAVMEEFMRCALPPAVLDTLHNVGVEPQDVLGALYPEHVASQVLEHLAQPLAQRGSTALQRPCTAKTTFPYRFRSEGVERQFLQWETPYMKWHLVAYSLFLFGLLGVHLNVCNPEPHSCACSYLQQPWPCGSRQTISLGFVLIWLPIICSALPHPYNYTYRESLCVAHQLMACYLVSSFTDQVATIHFGTTWRILDPLFFCVLPILIESIGAKIRIMLHIPLNALQVAGIIWPWFTTDLVAQSMPVHHNWLHWAQCIMVMLGLPGSLLALLEKRMRDCFESTFS